MSPSDTSGLAALAAVQEAWNAAARHWDPVALAEVYTTDALLLGGRPGHASGRAEVRAYFESYLGVIRSAEMQLIEQQVFLPTPSCCVGQGFGNFSFQLSDGQATRSSLRTTFVVIGSGPWRIRAQHVSPIPAAPPLGT